MRKQVILEYIGDSPEPRISFHLNQTLFHSACRHTLTIEFTMTCCSRGQRETHYKTWLQMSILSLSSWGKENLCKNPRFYNLYLCKELCLRKSRLYNHTILKPRRTKFTCFTCHQVEHFQQIHERCRLNVVLNVTFFFFSPPVIYSPIFSQILPTNPIL